MADGQDDEHLIERFVRACRHGDLAAVRQVLLDNPEKQQKILYSSLIGMNASESIAHGHFPIIEYCFTSPELKHRLGFDHLWNTRDWYTDLRHEFLIQSLVSEDSRFVRFFMTHPVFMGRISPGTPHISGRNPFMWACLAGSVPSVKYMLEDHFDWVFPDEKCQENGLTALQYAIEAGNRPVIHYLVGELGWRIKNDNLMTWKDEKARKEYMALSRTFDLGHDMHACDVTLPHSL